MKRIETELYKPSPDNPDKLVYAGQRPAQEVFHELRYRLKSTGYMPDEYFLMDNKWENGVPYPEDAVLSYDVNYGASEGIYLDITIHYTDEQGNRIKNHFATGKTLSESASDLDRMFLIASACTKAFHTDGLHARYMMLGKEPQPESMVLHLSEAEREFVIDSLIDVRSWMQADNKPVDPAEQLLRRIIGSITEYMEAVGERPRNISSYDYAVLSVRDSNIKGFLKVYQEIACEEIGDLLVHAAARPGRIGKEMTELLLAGAKDIPCETYMAACKCAVNICDLDRAVLLFEKADNCVKNLDVSMYASVIEHALYSNEKRGNTENIALALIKKCTPEQISAANPYLLENAIVFNKVYVAYELIKKGMPHDPDKVMFDVARSRNTQTFYMLRREMGENLQYSGALRFCMRWNNLDAAIFLLRNGVGFEKFRDAPETKALNNDQIAFLSSLTHYWEENIKGNNS